MQLAAPEGALFTTLGGSARLLAQPTDEESDEPR